MKRNKELIHALTQLLREAAVQDIIINEISLPDRWFVGSEKYTIKKHPDRLLGVDIKN